MVLLNKAILQGSVRRRPRCGTRLPFVDVRRVSAKTAAGLDSLAPYLKPFQTVAFLGSSGAGKSTLINRLLGRDLLDVAAVRDSDGKGRHTTTSRQLVEMPGGALLDRHARHARAAAVGGRISSQSDIRGRRRARP